MTKTTEVSRRVWKTGPEHWYFGLWIVQKSLFFTSAYLSIPIQSFDERSWSTKIPMVLPLKEKSEFTTRFLLGFSTRSVVSPTNSSEYWRACQYRSYARKRTKIISLSRFFFVRFQLYTCTKYLLNSWRVASENYKLAKFSPSIRLYERKVSILRTKYVATGSLK